MDSIRPDDHASAHPNQKTVDRFFEAYGKRDMAGIRKVMAEDATWYFLGRHPLAGVKKGVDEIVAFFDTMAGIMGESKPRVEKPIVSANGNFLIECVHTTTNRPDGNNLDHFACVLWTFANGKITEGRHFFADPPAVDRYFTAVAPRA
jgi:ketosteroid isomerase-like protein